MPKGIRRTLTLGEEIRELDRILMSSVRKNLAVARKVAEESAEGEETGILRGLLKNHSLLVQDSPQEPKVDPPPLSERERITQKLGHFLSALSETDLLMLTELARSMRRSKREVTEQGKAKDSAASPADSGSSPSR